MEATKTTGPLTRAIERILLDYNIGEKHVRAIMSKIHDEIDRTGVTLVLPRQAESLIRDAVPTGRRMTLQEVQEKQHGHSRPFGAQGEAVNEVPKAEATRRVHTLELTPAEVQSKYDRLKFAEALISQLSSDHDGRNTWLLNYGNGTVAKEIRSRRNGIEATKANGVRVDAPSVLEPFHGKYVSPAEAYRDRHDGEPVMTVKGGVIETHANVAEAVDRMTTPRKDGR